MMEISKVERLILKNQYKILSILEQDKYEKEICQLLSKAFEYGYPEADGEIEKIHDKISDEKEKFVNEVLKMYGDLEYSYRSIPIQEKNGIEESDIAFKGFNSHKEKEEYEYSFFILNFDENCEDLIKVKGFKKISSENMSDIYRGMLERYKTTENYEKSDLTIQEIKFIIGK